MVNHAQSSNRIWVQVHGNGNKSETRPERSPLLRNTEHIVLRFKGPTRVEFQRDEIKSERDK